MMDRGVKAEVPTTPNGPASSDQPESLEQRVHRLEDAVAVLQDTRHLEERVFERVSNRVKRDPAHAIQESAGAIADAGRKILPAALGMLGAQSENAEQEPQASSSDLRRPWLLFDAYAEARSMVRMYFDPRYRMSWRARTIPLVVLVVLLTSAFWLPGTSIPVMGTIFDKIVDIVLAFLAFKLLSREARRYREVIADLPITPRS